MLEFFRRTAPADAAPPPPELEPLPRMLVLRRSQAVVAIVACGFALLLAFLLGHAVGAPGRSDDALAPDVYVIRAAAYRDDDQGKIAAESVRQQLERLDLGEEIGLRHVPSERTTVVTVGSWLTNPEASKVARALRDRLRALKDRGTQQAPFAEADFWLIRR
jgi:hypothetical protein